VLIVDDLHDRVIVVDRKSKEIIWQRRAGCQGPQARLN
jgi:hypothetical protein